MLTKPSGASGIPPGQRMAPFAVPLALGNLNGDANVATAAGQGAAGAVPACSVRGPEVLNICQQYEEGPVVLALFVDGGSCPARGLATCRRWRSRFPACASPPSRSRANVGGCAEARSREEGLTLPVGIDEDGALAALYRLASCPQVTFAYPGGDGAEQGTARRAPARALRARVAELVAASQRARVEGAAGVSLEREGPGGEEQEAGPPREGWRSAEVELELSGLRLLWRRGAGRAPDIPDRRLAARRAAAPARALEPLPRRARGRRSAASRYRPPTGSSTARSVSTPTSCGRRSRRRCWSGCCGAASSAAACSRT